MPSPSASSVWAHQPGAIDEFKEQSQRKEYLDAQNADLMEALETLENAIRKIDRETRTAFQGDTFERVNAGLQEMFPRLFGGGEAYLEMTGEDLLDHRRRRHGASAGQAQLSTIHLLSGGEKALTAVALVFSIFELNPAPFCMLDEVDAPLDEANVGRFCRPGEGDVRPGAVHLHHPQQGHHGDGGSAGRSHHARAGRLASGGGGRGRSRTDGRGLRGPD
jgi:hypothetical protein